MHALLAVLLSAAAPHLDATDETLRVTTSSAATLDVTVSFIEVVTATGAHAGGGSQLTQIASATTTTVLAAPSASNTRAASQVKACNINSTSNTIILKHDKAATERVFARASLAPSECLACNDTGDCLVLGSGGVQRVTSDPPGYSGLSLHWSKVATAIDTIGYHYLVNKDTGFPGAHSVGTPGVNGVNGVCDVVGTAGTGGALSNGSHILPDPATGGWYLTRFGVVGAVANTYELVDLVWYNTGLVVTTGAQAITTPALPARDINGSANGDGYRIALYALTTLGNAAAIANTTVTYTNQAGTAGRTGTFSASVGFQAPATALIGTWMPFSLQAGDTGVRAISSFNTGTTYTSGTLMLVIYRPLALDGVVTANFPSGSLAMRQAINPGVRIYNDTCFGIAVNGSPAVTAPSFTGGVVELMAR